MAFSAGRRSLSHHLLACRLHPSLSHLVPSSHHDRHQGQDPSSPSALPNPTQRHPPFPFPSDDLRRRSRSQHLTLLIPLPFGAHLAAHRNFSSTSSPGAETDVFLPSIAAAAAADWFPPITALQHALEAVHSLTGLHWWVSIVLTTVLVRTSMIFVPRLVKSTMKNYNSMDPRPQVGKTILGELFTKCGRYVQPSIFMSFLFSIVNMVEKVPSLKEGGACWFTDLTTPDELYILPVLATMTLLATTEIIMREGMVENHVPQTLKFSRVLMAMILPFSSFPKPDGVIDAVARLISDAASSVVAELPLLFSGEVSAAAADSFLPVAAVQHLIDAVHSTTGLNWWASIALATLLVRTATIPLLVRQIKAENRLSALKPEIITFIKEGDSGDPQSRQDSRKKMFGLLKMHDVSPLTPFKRLFIQGPIILSFYYAVRNMIEQVPSLKGGGAYWFTDLTTPDELYILPVLTSMTVAADELNWKARIQGKPIPVQRTAKNFKRALAVLIIPLSISSCKAHFFWWVPWTMFTFAYRLAFRTPAMAHFVRLPHPVPQSAPAAAQVPAPTSSNLSEGMELMPAPASANLSEGTEPMPAIDSPPAATSSSEPSNMTEKKRRTPRVMINRVRGDCSSSDWR